MKVDAVMLLVQCLVVAVIGMICWLALRKDRPSGTYQEGSYEKRQTGSGPPAKGTLEQIPAKGVQSATISQSSQQVTEKDFIDFVAVNADKYLLKFQKFESGGSSIAWHWPVVFASAWWMVYRKLYGWAIALFVFGVIMGHFPAVVSLSVGLLSSILLGMFANYIYYKHTRKKILSVKSKVDPADSLALSGALQKTGGVHRWVPILVVILSILALVGIGAALWIPQFAADRQESGTAQKPSERYDGQVTPERKLSEQELSKIRLAEIEKEFPNILKTNPDRDPYILEEGMNAIRESSIAPYNYPTADDLEKFGRERIAKKAQRQAERITAECVSGNCKDGQGTVILSNGDRYAGQFKNYKYHKGTYFFQNGEIYEGTWKGGEFYEGTKTFPNGEQYWGKWKGFRPHGRGFYTWPNGQKYEGDFSEGRFHGQGKLTHPDGSYEVGEWKNGMAAGVIKVPPNSE